MSTTGYIDLPVEGGGSGGVTSLNSLTGDLTLAPGAGITLTPSGTTITIAATGSSSAITSLTGDVVATGPGAAASTIQSNVVTNAKIAQSPANTIKGNNTGSTANVLDLTASQVTAMLSPFVGDSGSGGTQGLVPAPPTGSYAAGDFLSANGSWSYVDQSKPINPSFSLVTRYTNIPSGFIKFENTTIYTSIANGKNYAISTGFNGSPALTIFDISDQTNPVAVGNSGSLITGGYNVSVGTVSGVQYAFIGLNSGSKLAILNITDPYSPTLVSNTTITGSPGSIYGVSFLNGYVYCATQATGLVVMDVGGGTGSPATPVQTYQQAGGIKSFGVVATGTNVYTTSYSVSPYSIHALQSWTLTGGGSPSVPLLLQTLTVPTVAEALGLSVNGNTAFVSVSTGNTTLNAYDLVDITTPSSMSNLSQIVLPGTNTIATAMTAVGSGNYVYIPSAQNATYGGAIDVYDITNRSSPIHISQVTTGVPTEVFGGIALSGGYIFAANYGTSGANGSFDVFTQINSNLIAGNVTASSVNISTASISAPSTTLTGSAGTAVCSEPFQGATYKKAVIYLNGYTDTSTLTYTFPTAFTHTPYIYGLTAGVAGATVTTTSITFTVTTATGFVFVEGF